MFLIRGMLQVTNQDLTSSINGIISGFAGIGHIILGVSLALLLIFIYQRIFKRNEVEE